MITWITVEVMCTENCHRENTTTKVVPFVKCTRTAPVISDCNSGQFPVLISPDIARNSKSFSSKESDRVRKPETNEHPMAYRKELYSPLRKSTVFLQRRHQMILAK